MGSNVDLKPWENGVKGFIVISTYHRTCPVHIFAGYLQRLQYIMWNIHEVEKRFQLLLWDIIEKIDRVLLLLCYAIEVIVQKAFYVLG